MKKITLIIIGLLLLINFTEAQKKIINRFGLGMSYDNISGLGGLVFQYKMFKGFVSINPELTSIRYGGWGIGLSSNFYLLPHKKITPFIGPTLTKTLGGQGVLMEVH